MKIMVFDVGNASCGLVVDNSGNMTMIDAGSNTEKKCPVDIIYYFKDSYLGHARRTDEKLILQNLIISHPDDDHIRNLEKIKESFIIETLTRSCHIEHYKEGSLSDGDSINYYAEKFCKEFRGDHIVLDRQFKVYNYFIPIEYVNNTFPDTKITNNSSLVTLIEYNGTTILFGGDLEEDGREYLIENNEDFRNRVSSGVDIFIAPHHGHKSAYSQKLFEKIGNVTLSVLSKGSEFEKEGTDVSSSYIEHSFGHEVYDFNKNYLDTKYTLTTRNNGLIIIEIDDNGNIIPLVEKQGN